MDLQADLLPLLPWWTRWAVPLATILLAFGSSWLFARLALLVAARGFDREDHWTRRARHAYVSRVVSGLLLVWLPLLWGMHAYNLHSPLTPLPAALLSACGFAASFAGVLLVHHASLQPLLPHPPTMRELLASFASLLLVHHSFWLLLLVFGLLAPSDSLGVRGLVWAGGLLIGYSAASFRRSLSITERTWSRSAPTS